MSFNNSEVLQKTISKVYKLMVDVEIGFTDILPRMLNLFGDCTDSEYDEEEEEVEGEVIPSLMEEFQRINARKHDESDVLIKNYNVIPESEKKEVIFSKYEQIIEKCKARILDHSNDNIKALYRYCNQNLSTNVSLFIYILLECIHEDMLLMIKICEIFRSIRRNSDYCFVEAFQKAIYTYKKKDNPFDKVHILLLQLLYSTTTLNSGELMILLQLYYGKDFPQDDLFSTRLSFPQRDTVTENKEKYILNQEIIHLEKMLDKERKLQTNSIPKPQGSNDIMQEAILQDSKNKHSRQYSDKFKAVCSIVYIYGPKAYGFLQKFFPLPNERSLRKWFSPEIKSYVENLMNKDNIPGLISEFIPAGTTGVHATLAIDAAKFKDIIGSTIKEMFPTLESIENDKTYSNLFVYYLQPINLDIKPFPVHIEVAENGSANDGTISNTKQIVEKLDECQIVTDFVATDGDHKYDHLHDEFFKIILEGIKANLSFDDIINYILRENLLQIPISDFLHSIKILRSNLAKYGVEVDSRSHATILPETLGEYEMGNTLTDLTQHGKMKDCYPLELFAERHIHKALETKNWNFIYYSLPINLLTNAIRNPYLANEVRMYLLETSFYFLIKLFYDLPNLKSVPHTRIGVIRLINTVVGLYVALCKYDYVHMGHIGTHPLENYFGFIRIASHYDHSCTNIFMAIGKAAFIKKQLAEFKLSHDIRTRAGYGGARASADNPGGIIPECSPFELFLKVYMRMRDPTLVEMEEYVGSWYSNFKTVPWNERIAGVSSESGSSIVARYVAKTKTAAQKQKESAEVKAKKASRKEAVRSVVPCYGLGADELAACYSESLLNFLHMLYNPVNPDLTQEKNELDADEYIEYHNEFFLNSLRSWDAWIHNLAPDE